MKQKKDDGPPLSKVKCNKRKAVDRGFTSLFAQTQTSLFKKKAKITSISSICFITECCNRQEHPLKIAKEDTSTPDLSDVATSDKASMPIINKDMSVQAVLSAPISSTSCTSAPIKAPKKYQDKVDKIEALKKEKEKIKTSSNEQKQPKDIVEKTSVIKTSLTNTCRYPKLVTLIQEVVDHVTQLNGEELPVITQNLFYNIFFIFVGQGKHASDSIKKNFRAFCESTSLTQSDLGKYASKGYTTIVSSMAKQYETLVHNYVWFTYEDRTLRHILEVLSEKASPYFCGDSLTVKQRKPLAKHIFQQKINPKSAWSSTVYRIERYETIVNNFLTFWSMYGASNDADVPSEANLYAKPQCYMKWLHFMQKELEQKKFIQEMKPQDKAACSYVHRKLQEFPFVKNLNTSKHRSLKEKHIDRYQFQQDLGNNKQA
ncbi:hypothetical protein BCV72DRAFT_329867 [Rhizopus microsporus var. microsporus]|uniref:Uncharacterized protein n=2 Tax=Rhizopus microsporus TaxID=58291 RepID=A0A2G4T704_RHIZD|nr:uncharacterized protein RHIMIDRAFT_246992 [Rhizopus microsporus ATCC 52813]ORE05927.1 hypothetical protein BCV72DRAFT_329867 [Rhizopus microsporus var. microsporus]PHZ16466.1 hypothetical protein RHIMIDRAFT_246992 [Rhizopus microsporus ATCC 52813]